MNNKLNSLLLLACATLCGCGGLYPSTRQSRDGLAFPLGGCTPEILSAAVSNLSRTDGKAPTFTAENVCVTDTRVQAGQRRSQGSSSAGAGEDVKPVRDASSTSLSDTVPGTNVLTSTDLEMQARAATEEQFRRNLEHAFLRQDSTPQLGIALSGGGSKAAAFGSGVLAGLADAGALDSANYVSTVSGGGYAAYFYYTHKVFPHSRAGGRRVASSRELFRDCVRKPGTMDVTEAVGARIREFGTCSAYELQQQPRPGTGVVALDNRYQAFVKCQQDVLQPGKCSIERTSGDLGMSGFMVASTLLTAIPSYFSTVIFDWGINTSPAAQTYRDGIGLTYGSTIKDPAQLIPIGKSNGPWKEFRRFECAPGAEDLAFDCRQGPGRQIPDPLRYEELLQAYVAARGDPSRRMPFWIMNAVAPASRSMLGWWSILPPETSSSDIFEMTALSHGSGRYGYVAAPASLHGLTVLDSVGAAAAFLDPNQNGLTSQPVLRGLLGVAQRLFNVDWGLDISNYNVSDARRSLHTAMPFPFLDAPVSKHIVHARQPAEDKERVGSVFIRLIDGGNGENLGAHALLRRGVRNILISDAGEDKQGNFLDLCELRRRLSHLPDVAADGISRNAKHLYVPGLPGFARHCKELMADRDVGYGVHGWPFELPVLFGCVRKQRQDEGRQSCAGLETAPNATRPQEKSDSRLFIVKPALDMARYRRDQTHNIRVQDDGKEGLRLQINECWLPGSASGIASGSGINCETALHLLLSWEKELGHCQAFPQHATTTSTANSSNTTYAAYRELARQYVAALDARAAFLGKESAGTASQFEDIARGQYDQAAGADLRPRRIPCDPKRPVNSPTRATSADGSDDRPPVQRFGGSAKRALRSG